MASSALAQQLALLGRDDFRVGKASLLYEARQAADIDVQTLFNQGLNGFGELCNLDTRFRPFAKSLFGRAGLEFARSTASREAVAKLDASLAAFCRLLSGYYLLPAATKALEYLIRRFAVHEACTEDLLTSLLPYHSTPEFVRLLQLLPLKGTPWQWLEPAQRSGAPPPRAVLAARCAQDNAVLALVVTAARALSRPAESSRTAVAFFGVLLAEAAAGAGPPSEPLLRQLMPYVLEGLGRDVAAEHTAAAYMVAAQLAARAPPVAEVASALLEGVARCPHAPLRPAALSLAALLLAVGPQPAGLPDRALKHLAKMPELPALLVRQVTADGRSGPLLRGVLSGVASRAAHHGHYASLMISLVTTLAPEVLDPHVGCVVAELLQLAMSDTTDPLADDSGAADDVVPRLLRALDGRCPQALDAALNKALAEEAATLGRRYRGKKALKGEEDDDDGKNAPPAGPLLLFLQSALLGSARQPLAGPHATLAACLDHPRPRFRLLALTQLADQLTAAPTVGSGPQHAMLLSALPRRMLDEDSSVAAAALALPSAASLLPPGILLTTTEAVLHKAAVALSGRAMPPSTSGAASMDPAGAAAVAKRAVRLLAGLAPAADALPLRARAVAALMGHMLTLGKARRLPRLLLKQMAAMVQAGGKMTLPLLCTLPAGHASGAAEDASEDRVAKKAADAALNRAVVEALAAVAHTSPEATEPVNVGSGLQQLVAVRAAGGPLARHLVLLSLMAAVAAPPKARALPDGAPLQAALWAACEEGLKEAEGSSGLDADTEPWAAGLPPAGHWSMLAQDVLAASACALPPALEALIRSLPSAAKEEGGRLPSQASALRRRIFAALAGLPPGLFATHTAALLASEGSPARQLGFLEDFVCTAATEGAEAAASTSAQAALAALAPLLTAGSCDAVQALALLLVALGAPIRPVRAAALGTAEALRAMSPPPGATPAVSAALALARVLTEERAALLAGDGPQRLGRLLLRELEGIAAEPPSCKLKPATRTALVSALRGCALRPTWVRAQPQASAALLRMLRGDTAPSAALLEEGPGLSVLKTLLETEGEARESPAAHAGSAELAAELAAALPAATLELPPLGPTAWALCLQVLQLQRRAGVAPEADPSAAGMSRVRASLLACVGAPLWACLSAAQRPALLQAALRLMAKEPDVVTRTAAHGAVERLPVSVADVLPWLTTASMGPAGYVAAGARKKKARPSAAVPGPEADSLSPHADPLESVRCMLEMLQWKRLLDAGPPLLTALSQLLRELMSQAAVEEAAEEANFAGEGHRSVASSAAYVINLTLSAMTNCVSSASGASGRAASALVAAADVDSALLCAGSADPESRAEALQLLAELAALAPASLVSAVLPLLGAVAASVQAGSLDAGGRLSGLLAAVIPPWLQQPGAQVHQLIDRFVDLMPKAPPHRRLPMLSALLATLPAEAAPAALPHALAAVLALPTAQTVAGQDEPAAPHSVEPAALANWPTQLASGLCALQGPSGQLRALTQLLMAATSATGPHSPAHAARLLAFVLTELTGGSAHGLRRALAATASADAGTAAEPGLLEAALMAVQDKSLTAAAGGAKAVRSALLLVLEALGELMPPGAYVQTLGRLLGSAVPATASRLRRHVQRLLAMRLEARLARRAAQLAAGLPAEPPAEEADEAAAYVALCPALCALLASAGSAPPSSAMAESLQGSLVLLDALARAYGRTAPEALLQCLRPALSWATAPTRALAASAFCAVGALLGALGPRALPLLPQVGPQLIEAAEAALRAAAAVGADADPHEAVAAAAGAAAVGSLIAQLGAFLSPLIPSVLLLLLGPPALHCRAREVEVATRSLRGSLPEHVPPRLLLTPLYERLEEAMRRGDASGAGAAAALELLAACATRLDRPSVAALHPVLADQLLAAMDLRRSGGPAGATPLSRAGLDAVEGAAVDAMGALVLRLSEATFRPLFTRVVEWARAPPPASAVVAAPRGRLHVLMRLAEHLTLRLRSVFVPFFRYLLDDAVAILMTAGGAESGTAAPQRKKKRVAAALADGADAGVEGWQLRVATVRALGACFAADTVGLVDGPTYERLAAPLVAQIEAVGWSVPPAAEPADVAAMEAALVPAIGSLAVAAGSDAAWKTLNRSVLMVTRSTAPRARLLALAVAAELVSRLAEEYLSLLPESLPFLAELLEDPEVPVEAATRALLAQLEALSGESLDEYLR